METTGLLKQKHGAPRRLAFAPASGAMLMLRFSLFVLWGWFFGSFAWAEPGDLWKGLEPGTYGVGFQFVRGVDPTRNNDSTRMGTPLGLALWYPAARPAANSDFITQLDYRLLEFSKPLDAQTKRDYIEEQARTMVAWRHGGIVSLKMEQARATLDTTGRAVRGQVRSEGKFPVVVILGGPWYLSTTAEFLASHGYLAVACVRFRDGRTEIPASDFRWSVENSVRDAEWALAELRGDPSADMENVTALGHGAGGLQAMLLGMRDRQVTAVANIDAAIFSSRTNPEQLIFYDPRLMRIPYLNILTADTKSQSDRYVDFEKMKFSQRYEGVLKNPELRHHDLSNVGRAVSASLGIRGAAQNAVLKNYADVQKMLFEFLEANRLKQSRWFTPWLQQIGTEGDYSISVRDAVEPAPPLSDVLDAIEDWTPQRLREAYLRDTDAEVFTENGILQILAVARSHCLPMALRLVPFATEVQGNSFEILRVASAVAESAGDSCTARSLADRCLVLRIAGDDWRARAAQTECRKRSERLHREPSTACS
jgi:pimeloyl-ACP methyl ester carboxylesterase